MRNIIYVTTAMDERDFKEYIPHWKEAPNPSNQNFHNKLIRCLALNNKVDVISIRPFSRSLCDMKKLVRMCKFDKNITWHYLEIKRTLIKKLLTCQKELNSILKDLIAKDTIIFTDTINIGLVHFLKHGLKKYPHVKVVGVVTDSPSNISGVGKSYTDYILKNTCHYDGYLALTKELNDLYNPLDKPNMIVEGLVESRELKLKPTKDKYFFFGGALMKRYGIYNLIEAFNEFSKTYPDYKLYIAGHHANKEELHNAIKNNPNISYLNMIPVKEVLELESQAIANINPRPFSEDLDRFSIPSKTIEYLVSGQPTICVKNTKLAKYFQEEIIWAKSDKPEDLLEALIKAATATSEIRKNLGSNGKQKALANFSLESVNKRIENELLDVIFK